MFQSASEDWKWTLEMQKGQASWIHWEMPKRNKSRRDTPNLGGTMMIPLEQVGSCQLRAKSPWKQNGTAGAESESMLIADIP